MQQPLPDHEWVDGNQFADSAAKDAFIFGVEFKVTRKDLNIRVVEMQAAGFQDEDLNRIMVTSSRGQPQVKPTQIGFSE